MPAVLNIVTFRSKHSNLRILRRSAEQMMNPTYGTVSITKPEVVYEFSNGVLELPPGKDVLEDKFNDDTQGWESQDAIEYLRTHDLFDVRFVEVHEVAPDPADTYAAIIDAYSAGDLLTLEGIGDEEFATFKRPAIMDRVRSAVQALEQTTAAAAAAAAPAPPVKPAPKAKE